MPRAAIKRLCACGCGRSIQPYYYAGASKGYGARKYALGCDRRKREFDNKNTSPTDLAWAAGVIDGEGCIHIRWAKNYLRGSRRHVLAIDVVNTDPRMIEKLKALFGGWIGISRRKTEVRKVRYIWTISSSRAAAVLRLVAPYVVTKPEEVQTALTHAATVRGSHRINKTTLALRKKCRQRLMDLHHWRAEPSFKQKRSREALAAKQEVGLA